MTLILIKYSVSYYTLLRFEREFLKCSSMIFEAGKAFFLLVWKLMDMSQNIPIIALQEFVFSELQTRLFLHLKVSQNRDSEVGMTSRGHQVQPLTQAGPRAASSLQQWSQSFLITPWKNDPQHL